MSREELVQQLLALTPEDRGYVLNAVAAGQSLPFDGFASEEIRQQVLAELEDRMQAYESGEMQGMEMEAAMAEIRANLNKRRASRASQ